MRGTPDVIAAQLVDPPAIVGAVFGALSGDAIAAAVDGLCIAQLGSAVAEVEFFSASQGCVFGLALDDARRVVVKTHGPGTDVAFLSAVQAVQRRAVQAGFPAPAPLLAPTPLCAGNAIAETLLDAGILVDAHDPALRRAVASGLVALIAACRGPLPPGIEAGPLGRDGGQLWPQPHDARLDFGATASGAEWIDAIATRALTIRKPGDLVIGHSDWRVEHLRIGGDGRVSATYDWDSISVAAECWFAGAAASSFTVDLERGLTRPDPDELLAFVDDYEIARGRPFAAAERRGVHASAVYLTAYTARCEHSNTMLGWGGPNSPSAGDVLPALAAQLLG